MEHEWIAYWYLMLNRQFLPELLAVMHQHNNWIFFVKTIVDLLTVRKRHFGDDCCLDHNKSLRIWWCCQGQKTVTNQIWLADSFSWQLWHLAICLWLLVPMDWQNKKHDELGNCLISVISALNQAQTIALYLEPVFPSDHWICGLWRTKIHCLFG